VERDARVLEHGADLDGELLAAIAALVESDPDALFDVRPDLADTAKGAAVRANRTFRPQYPLKESERRFVAVELGLTENRNGDD
jgi:hypothetical protein